MSGPGRKWLLVVSSLAVALVGAMLWSYGYLEEQRSAARGAREEDASCQEIARRIELLRGQGVSATTRPAGPMDLTRQIAQAAADAGLPDRSLEAIHSDPARRSAAGAFIEKPTRLVVRGATLRQIISLLQRLDRPAEGLRVERLRLTAPNDSNDVKIWAAEATLLYTLPDKAKVSVATLPHN